MRYAVIRTNIIGTRHQVFSAWAENPTWDGYSTVTTIEDRPFGRVGTERMPTEIDSLSRFTDERASAYRAWRAETYRKAYDLIRRAFLGPDGIDGAFGYDMGEVRWTADIAGGETRSVEA